MPRALVAQADANAHLPPHACVRASMRARPGAGGTPVTPSAYAWRATVDDEDATPASVARPGRRDAQRS